MHLMRRFFFFVARYNFYICAEHIAGKCNVAADALSRDKMAQFFQQVVSAKHQPTPIPDNLIQLLVVQRPDWTLTLFASIL